MPYKHITPDQRNEPSALKRTKIKQEEIAQLLGKNRTTIYREIIRNKNKNGKYDTRIAKQKTKERRIKANQRFRKIENNRWLRTYLIKKNKKVRN
ncbi:MAG: helix-turn-helix domain-containing protein [Patescibacteria group bacterium]|nr:helix-turn-helix domain-containing protein [Patescibacteria group bacterium]